MPSKRGQAAVQVTESEVSARSARLRRDQLGLLPILFLI